MGTVRKSVFLILVVLLILLVAAGAAVATKPTRVIIFTMDQMKPWYVEAYDMDHLRWLENRGANFINARVGQMASETVVSHNSFMSGLYPKHMGWADEVMRDVDGILGDAGGIYTVGDLSYAQYEAIIDHYGYPKFGDYMHDAYPDRIVANFGEKAYQVYSTAASSSDYWVTMGSRGTNTDPLYLPWIGIYQMPGGNVPDYITTNKRFLISVRNKTAAGNDYYNTDIDMPAALYKEDGRHVPGPYDSNQSGDAWVADAAIEVMRNEDWSFLHLNFSGIDKVGHMWGAGPIDTVSRYGWDPMSLYAQVHMPFIAKFADEQVGKVLDELKAQGVWDETMVVVLADHGSTYAQNAYMPQLADGANLGWYYDPNNLCVNTTYGRAGKNNEALLAPLNADGNLAYSYQSTAIEAWLIDQAWSKKLATAEKMKTLPGVIATYVLAGDHYQLVSTGKLTATERIWWATNAQSIIDKMAYPGAADVVGLLKDRTSYGAYGDHGGAQQDVQRIPMIMYSPGMKHTTSIAPFKLVDVLPTVLKAMDIPLQAPVDGKAYNLPIAP